MTEPATFTMSITPFTADGELDEATLRSHLRFLADSGVGVYLCSQGSGEGDLLSLEERVRVYEIGVDEVRGRVPVYAAGIGLAHSTARIISTAQGAVRAGVDAVYVLGPRPGAIAPRPNEIEAYYREVIEAIDAPVVISNNTSLAGYAFGADLCERLVRDYPNVKEILLAADVPLLTNHIPRLLANLGDRITIRVGNANQAMLAHALGAHGMLNYEANVAPRLTESIWTALRAGDGSAALASYARFMQLSLLMGRFGNPRVIKDALRILGRDGGHLRKPYLPLPEAEQAELAAGLAAIGLQDVETF